MTAFLVMTFIAGTWLVLWGVKNWRADAREHREQSSWLAQHERDIAYRRRQREVAESRRIGWRR